MSKQFLLLKQYVFLPVRYAKTWKQSPSEYCFELVRSRDYENFLCTLLLPKDIRAVGLAIRAFNVEIAQVEDYVSNSTIGQMRLQFWLETLNNIYNGVPPKTPVALELHRVLSNHKLSKLYFKRLIDSRLQKLGKATFQDLESLEKYSENSVSSIYYLLLEAQGIKDLNADHVASHLGKAHGISTIIRAVPYDAKRRILALPQEILMKHNVSSETVFRGQCTNGMKDAVLEIASCAKSHLDQAKSLRKTIKKNINPTFLPLICVENYLNHLQDVNFDVFHVILQRRDNLLPLKLWWKKLWF